MNEVPSKKSVGRRHSGGRGQVGKGKEARRHLHTGGPRHGLCDCSMQSGSRGVVDDIMNILVNGPQRFKMSIESKYQMLWSWLETQPNKDNQWKQLLVIKSYK